MSYRILARKVKEFMKDAFAGGLWKKYTRLNVTPEVMDVKVRETSDGYAITVQMKVKL